MAKQKIGLHMSLSYSMFNEGPRLGREAEERGYTSLWTGEVAGPDPFLNLGAIASNTSRVELATGVVPDPDAHAQRTGDEFSHAQRNFTWARDRGAWRVESNHRRAMAWRVVSQAGHHDA